MDTYAIKNEIYPYIKSKYEAPKFKQLMTRFINKRSTMLHDTCPCDRISFMADDRDDFFKTFGIDIKEVNEMLSHTYYWNDAKFRAMAAKDEFTVCVMCIIRLLYETKQRKDLDLACAYLAFSGKFYPSMHYVCFPIAPTQYRYIMEYVVNNKLTSKFDLKKEGSVFKTINRLTDTWLSTYMDELKDFSDEDVAYMILQLRDRIKAMLKNVAAMYYDAFEKREYITFDTDNEDEDSYHKADSISLQVSETSQKVISNMITSSIDYRLCKYVSNSDVKTDEIRSILESIFDNKQNIPLIEELIGILLMEYLTTYPNGRASDIRFVSFSNAAKPNSKNPNIIRQKEILEILLSENSPAYNKRKSRIATKNSYNKAILAYFILYTHNCSR